MGCVTTQPLFRLRLAQSSAALQQLLQPSAGQHASQNDTTNNEYDDFSLHADHSNLGQFHWIKFHRIAVSPNLWRRFALKFMHDDTLCVIQTNLWRYKLLLLVLSEPGRKFL